jgi:hypothetical protein
VALSPCGGPCGGAPRAPPPSRSSGCLPLPLPPPLPPPPSALSPLHPPSHRPLSVAASTTRVPPSPDYQLPTTTVASTPVAPHSRPRAPVQVRICVICSSPVSPTESFCDALSAMHLLLSQPLPPETITSSFRSELGGAPTCGTTARWWRGAPHPAAAAAFHVPARDPHHRLSRLLRRLLLLLLSPGSPAALASRPSAAAEPPQSRLQARVAPTPPHP